MIIAAIPVRNQLRWTAPLIDSLLIGDKVDQVWLYDNGSTDKTISWAYHKMKYDDRLYYKDASGMRLYEMWNNMVARASNMNDAKLAILNNDIRLPFMALKNIADNMQDYQIAAVDTSKRSFDKIENVYPEKATWQQKTGHAFMIDANFWQGQKFAVHPQLIWWWGDDDLFRRCEARGGNICIMKGIGVDHGESESDPEYVGDKWRDIELDRVKFRNIWASPYSRSNL